MKLSYVELCGFRSYRQRARVDFAPGFTIIDGRNGVGKSTLFDAVEYALTGSINKYLDSKANQVKANKESVLDYVWWTGEGDTPPDRYVEVGFVDKNKVLFVVRRTEFGGAPPDTVEELTRLLTVTGAAPEKPLRQLCDVALIRDEHIAEFSLDLPEADRYTLLRQALGATDGDDWVTKGAEVEKAAKTAAKAAEADLKTLRQTRDAAVKRADEANQSLQSDAAIQEATERLQTFVAAPSLSGDALVALARKAVGELGGRIEAMTKLRDASHRIEEARTRRAAADDALDAAARDEALAREAIDALAPAPPQQASEAATQARQLTELVALGRQIGLRSGDCPLCGCSHADQDSFERGLAAAEAVARDLNGVAVERATRESERKAVEIRLADASQALKAAQQMQADASKALAAFDRDRAALGLGTDVDGDELRTQIADAEAALARASSSLRTLGTTEFDDVLQREKRRVEVATEQLDAAERVAGRTRKAAATAKALNDAARRAVSETLDERLGRVQPLMSELYQRLNPHPVWKELDYAIRGDVKRFMTLQVGGKHNPQFIFSSGQRRATGLAFLLSVNLSLAWSQWRTIMLDDPVQHVDDFRAIHLAEVMGQLVRRDRQVVCAVEDAALADLLCRRLPNGYHGAARRVSLKLEADGSSSVDTSRIIPELPRHSITTDPDRRMVG